jgi:hypothetical protein
MPARKGRIVSVYLWSREDGELVTLGEVRSFSNDPYGGVFHVTEDRATAKVWAEALASGRTPVVAGEKT